MQSTTAIVAAPNGAATASPDTAMTPSQQMMSALRADGYNYKLLTTIKTRLIDAAAEISEVPPEKPSYLHSVLCQVGLPRSRTDGRMFERTTGNTSLLVEAGKLWNGCQWVEQPLPYGTRPRLALVHISSEAIRTKSRTVEIGNSVREFLRLLGADTGGHEYRRFQIQMRALAACRMTLGVGLKTVDAKPIEEFKAWLNSTGEQRTLWPGTLELSQRFYDTLREFAVPMDPRALLSLKHSALALDVYSWLAHRLHRVKQGGAKLHWSSLRDQFGQEYADPKNFRREMKKALRTVLAVYPQAKVEEIPTGLLFLPSAPPIAKTKVSLAIAHA